MNGPSIRQKVKHKMNLKKLVKNLTLRFTLWRRAFSLEKFRLLLHSEAVHESC